MIPQIIYIAGPMRGYDEYNSPAFYEMEKLLRDMGYLVLNPAILPKDLPSETYMPICLAMLRECDAVIMLDGYLNSEGAMIEYCYAIQCGKPVATSISELKEIFS